MHALGTEVVAVGDGADDALAEVLRLEAILTRFRPSALTRLNEDGRTQDPPPELVGALRHALQVAERSDGLITPTILPALEHAGYRRSWPHVVAPGDDPPPTASWREIVVRDDVIELPAGARLDLGGTAKTWIAERAARRMRGEILLDAGGDVLVDASDLSAIDVEPPPGGVPRQLLLAPGRWGVATSSVARRAWPGAHHLIDPRSGRSARTRWLQVTAVGPTPTGAEVAAKLALLDRPGDDGHLLLAYDRDGSVWTRREGDWIRDDLDDRTLDAA